MFRCWPMPARMGDSAPFSAPYVKLWLLCRTPLCAPRFAFHVHAFQTRSFRRFPLYGDFLVRPPGASPFVKIPSPAARLFPCRKLHRPALLHCAPGQYPARLALPSMFMLFRHVPSGAFPSTEISPSVHPTLSLLRRLPRRFIWRFPLCEDSLVGRPAFSRVGSYTGLRFCIAPLDNTLRASLCLPCPYFSSKFPSK